MRRYNLSEYDRIWVPLPSITDPQRRGLINEAAFIFFCENHGKERKEVSANLEALLEDSFSRSARFLQLEPHHAKPVEKREVVAIAGRLDTFFQSSQSGGGALQINPEFPGCGIVGHCVGDVIRGDTLYEVKAGDRNFRSIDFRQLLVYAALRFSHDSFIFPRIGIVNPRTGISVRVETQTFCKDSAGLDPFELFERVLSSLSANLVSD